MDLYSYKPQNKFSQKHMLTLLNYSRDEMLQILSLALKLKAQNKNGIKHHLLSGKTLAMIFSKSSTRTRVSFETGFYQLGGYPMFLSAQDIQLNRGETIADTAKTLSRMVDGIMIRTFAQKDVDDLAKYGSVPVINALTDDYHPCQALADLLTYFEHKGDFKGKLCFVGDGNNVANSLMIGCLKVGLDFAVATPPGYEVNSALVEQCREIAAVSGSTLTVTHSPQEAAKDADCIYTDVWASMGQEGDAIEKHKAFGGFQVNEELFANAKGNAVFMHCLPAHRGEEVSADVIDGKRSVVFDEAENRLHVQKALMVLLMGDKHE